MAVSDNAVGTLDAALATATDDGVAARLVSAVLQAADAPPLNPVCPGPRAAGPALIAAAYLDASTVTTGLAWSARSALTLYDAHENWSGGVDELEEEQANDLVVRVAALAAVAACLHTDPHQGLALLLDSPAGRSLLYVMGSIELLLSRGTAFEPVEPGVMGDLIGQHADALEATWAAVRHSGGQTAGAETLVDEVASAIEDAAEAVGDRIEDIAEAMRSVLPELDGGRQTWAAEARRERVYGLLIGHLFEERTGASAPAVQATSTQPSGPDPALVKLQTELEARTERQRQVACELSAARSQRDKLRQQAHEARAARARPAQPTLAQDVADPVAERRAVAEAAEAVKTAQETVKTAQAARDTLQPPDRAGEPSGSTLPAARQAVAACTAAVSDVQARRTAAEQHHSQRVAATNHRRSDLQAQLAKAATRRRTIAQRLGQARQKRDKVHAQRQQTGASAAATPAAPTASTPARTREDIRRHAVLRGALLRARAKVVTARAEASHRQQGLRKLRAPKAPAPRSGRRRPDTTHARSLLQSAEQAVAAARARIEAAQDARRNRTEQLQTRLARARARATELGPLRTTLDGQRRRLATRRYEKHSALQAAKKRPAPVAQPVQDTLTPERREELEDLIFEANQALHRARWGLSRAQAAHAEGLPDPPEAPDHQYIHRILRDAREDVATAEQAVAAVRARRQVVVDARRQTLAQLGKRREEILRSLGSSRRQRDSLSTDRATISPRQDALREHLAQHPTVLPEPLDKPPEVRAATEQLEQALAAVAAAQEALANTASRGGSLPPLPEPRPPRTPIDLRRLAKQVRKADRAVSQVQAQRDAALSALAALQAPLKAEHERLLAQRAERSSECQTHRELQSAAQARQLELHARLAELREQLSAIPSEPPDPTEPARAALAEAEQARTAASRLLSEAVEARAAMPQPPEGDSVQAGAQAAREAAAQCRIQLQTAEAKLEETRGRRDRHVELKAQLTALCSRRDAHQQTLSDRATARTQLATQHEAASEKVSDMQARLAAQKLAATDDTELVLMRELTAAAAAALAEARAELDTHPEPEDPPTRPPAPDTSKLTRRLARARRLFARYEQEARQVERRRDEAYIALRREHRAALTAARPSRRLTALRRRKAALERALTARRQRLAELVPSTSDASQIDQSLQPAVEAAGKRLAEARELLGQRISAVAEVRGEMGRTRVKSNELSDRIDEIDAQLARWTRRKRRAARAIDKLKARQQDASAAPPPAAPPEPLLAPPPAPAPGVPVLHAAPPPVPQVLTPELELSADASAEPPSVPPPQVPGSGSDSQRGSSVQSLLASIAARRQARVRSPGRRDPDSSSVPPPVVPGLKPGRTEADAPPPVQPPPPSSPAPPVSDQPKLTIAPDGYASMVAEPTAPEAAAATPMPELDTPTEPPARMAPAPPPPALGPPAAPALDSSAAPPPPALGPPAAPPPPALGPPAAPALDTPTEPPARMAAAPPPPALAPPAAPPPPWMGPPAAAPPPPGLAQPPSEIPTLPPLDTAPPPPASDAPALDLSKLPGPPVSLHDAKTDRLARPSIDEIPPAPALELPLMPPPPPLPSGDALPPPDASEVVPAPDEAGAEPAMPTPRTLSNQHVHNAKTVILSLDSLRKQSLEEEDFDDDDDDDGWPGGDGAATVLLSREEQLKRRDLLLAELGKGPSRRREAWKPGTKGQKE